MILYRLLGRLPLPLLYPLAWPAYLAVYWLAGYRKAVVKENLQAAFPDKSAGEVTVLAKKFYLQLVRVALEVIRAPHMSPAEYRRRVKLRNPELLRSCSRDFRQPVLILSIHQGNWEWMLHGITLALDIPVDPVYKPLHNPSWDKFMLAQRSRFGSRPVPMAAAGRAILRQRGQFRALAMLADQSPIRGERSYWTRFLNREAAFYLGAEVIARAGTLPVLYARCSRRAQGYYEIEFTEIGRPPYARDGHALTERYVELAEQAIRADPPGWLWSNRRWKRQRVAGEDLP